MGKYESIAAEANLDTILVGCLGNLDDVISQGGTVGEIATELAIDMLKDAGVDYDNKDTKQ